MKKRTQKHVNGVLENSVSESGDEIKTHKSTGGCNFSKMFPEAWVTDHEVKVSLYRHGILTRL